jgi:hypothetical protein
MIHPINQQNANNYCDVENKIGRIDQLKVIKEETTLRMVSIELKPILFLHAIVVKFQLSRSIKRCIQTRILLNKVKVSISPG